MILKIMDEEYRRDVRMDIHKYENIIDWLKTHHVIKINSLFCRNYLKAININSLFQAVNSLSKP